MQVGIDSFAAWDNAGLQISPSERLQRLVEQIEYADQPWMYMKKDMKK